MRKWRKQLGGLKLTGMVHGFQPQPRLLRSAFCAPEATSSGLLQLKSALLLILESKLTSNQKHLLSNLRYFENCAIGETARICSAGNGTDSSTVRRALHAFKKMGLLNFRENGNGEKRMTLTSAGVFASTHLLHGPNFNSILTKEVEKGNGRKRRFD